MKTTTFAGLGLASRRGLNRCCLGVLLFLGVAATNVDGAVWVEAGYHTYSGTGWIPVWVDGHWVVVQHVDAHWETETVAGHWDDQWVDGHNESVWVDGYWEDQWNDGHWEDQWNDGHWEDQWNDGHWEDQWNDGYEDEEGNWNDGYWSSNWVDGYWSSNWVDGYWSSNWVDGYWSSNWVDGHWEDQWVDGYWTSVWIPETTQQVWVDAYDISEWVDGGWTLGWGNWTVTVWEEAHWVGDWVWSPFDTASEWSYSAWSPDPGTVSEGVVFQQSRTASRLHRTGESNEAGEERNVATSTETAGPFYQDATGTKPLTWTGFNEPGSWYYSAWSPDPSTVPIGQTFEQSRTAYRDHRIGERNELGGERNVTTTTETGETSYQNNVGTGGGGGGKPTPVGTFAGQIVYNQGLLVVDSSMLNAVFRHPTTFAILSGTINYSAVRVNTGEVFNPFVPQNSAPGNPGMSAFYGALQVTATFQANATYNAATVTATFQNLDNQPPSVPGNFRRVVVGPNSFSVAWEPSSDNSQGPPELISYELTLNGGGPFPASSGITHTFTGVAANTQQTVEVRARDYFGNLSGPATVTVTTPAAGADPTHEQRWIDVDGDGIPDEVVGGDSGIFYYYAAQTQTTTVTSVNWTTEYWPFPVTYSDGVFGFNWWWVPITTEEYDTYTVNSVRPKFIFTTEPGYEYTICRVLSPTQYVRLFPPSTGLNGEWQPPGFWPEDAYNALPFALARIAKPVSTISISSSGISIGNISVTTSGAIVIPNGTGGSLTIASIDALGRILNIGTQVVTRILDAAGNVLMDLGLGNVISLDNLPLAAAIIETRQGSKPAQRTPVVILRLGIARVVSDQIPGIPGSFVNRLPDQNRIVVAPRTDGLVYIRVEGSLVDSSGNAQPAPEHYLLGVRGDGLVSILGNAPMTGSVTDVKFAAYSTHFQVVGGTDVNADGLLQPAEVTAVHPGRIRVFNQSDYTFAWTALAFGSNTPLIFGHARALLDAFANDTVPAGPTSTNGAMLAAGDVTHRVGMRWLANETASTRLYTWQEGSAVSDDVELNSGLLNGLRATLGANAPQPGSHAREVNDYFAQNPDQTSHVFTWTYSQAIAFDGLSLFLSFGHVTINGSISVTVSRQNLAVTSATYSGSFDDVYDFDSNAAQPAPQAATVQTGFGTIGGNAGRVVRTRVLFANTLPGNTFAYQFPVLP
jgi:hypothetical protein